MRLIRLLDATSFGGRRFAGKNPFDFVGHVLGRPLAVEAKETRDDVIYRSKLLQEQSQHQYDALIAWADSHPTAIAGYLCYLGVHHTILWVPVQAIDQLAKIDIGAIGMFGIRGINLATQAVDWHYLYLGGTHGNSKLT